MRATVARMGLHWQELVIILVLALVIFGPKRLPEIGRSMGKGLREFKTSVSGPASEVTEVIDAAKSETKAAVPVEVDKTDDTTSR